MQPEFPPESINTALVVSVSPPFSLKHNSVPSLRSQKFLSSPLRSPFKSLYPNMPQGKLDVLLVSAKSLEDTDFLGNMDPYVVITCRTQEKKSSVASGKGSNPEWNENFTFTITNDVNELRMKIMDSDSATADDFVGEVSIPLETLFIERSIPLASYNVVKEDKYCGEIRVGLTFTPAESLHRGFDTREEGRHHGFGAREESYGGWKESAYTD